MARTATDDPIRAKYEQLALGRMAKETYDQIAAQTGVSVRTLKRWAATSEYAELFRTLQVEHRRTARARATLWADDILGVLYQLAMTDGRSQLVRYHAAAKLADILGLGQDPDSGADSSQAELDELYAVLRAAKGRADVPDPRAYTPRGGLEESAPYEAIELRRPALPDGQTRVTEVVDAAFTSRAADPPDPPDPPADSAAG